MPWLLSWSVDMFGVFLLHRVSRSLERSDLLLSVFSSLLTCRLSLYIIYKGTGANNMLTFYCTVQKERRKVSVSYSHLCPLRRLVEGPPLHSWHLKGALVMAWLDPEQRNSKVHLNIPSHILANIHLYIHPWFHAPGRVYDKPCLQVRREKWGALS